MMVLSVLAVSVRGHIQIHHATGGVWLVMFVLSSGVLSVLSVLLITPFSASLPYLWMCAGTDTAKTDETPTPPQQPPVVFGGLL
jgi:hypothetical protein